MQATSYRNCIFCTNCPRGESKKEQASEGASERARGREREREGGREREREGERDTEGGRETRDTERGGVGGFGTDPNILIANHSRLPIEAPHPHLPTPHNYRF